MNLVPVLYARTYISLVQSSDSQDETWSLSILTKFFHDLATEDKIPQKICLFINGLIECKDNYKEVIELIRGIVALGNVKVCMSSRP